MPLPSVSVPVPPALTTRFSDHFDGSRGRMRDHRRIAVARVCLGARHDPRLVVGAGRVLRAQTHAGQDVHVVRVVGIQA